MDQRRTTASEGMVKSVECVNFHVGGNRMVSCRLQIRRNRLLKDLLFLSRATRQQASAYADLQQHRSEGVHRKPSPVSGYVPQPDYLEEDEDNDLIKPKKLVNPVKASKSHQELHRELMSSCKRSSGVSVETKPELQRVLESRKRDQLIKQRKQEEEARRKISPLEAELLKRHQKLDELDKQQEKEQEENLKAPEFVKVKENLRRTSFHKEEKEV
ncbi:protein FAM107B isoform X1 [Gasterosteus aculeatus]|uniref:Actin-associated protein FAM107A n=2 Tax=Gasterosteus aculeatus aculeatus TaxID=481459 RepID=A0AAQ4QSW4_GASAC|nr:protein FAM107B-like isoform X1 [Gasterosteus aculeatus aculeatus]